MTLQSEVKAPEFTVTVHEFDGYSARYSVTSWYLESEYPGVLFIKNANNGWKGAYAPGAWKRISSKEPNGE